jgi:hypothetical protein
MLAERQNNCPGLQGRVYYWYIHEDEIRYPILWHEQKNHTVCTAKASRDDDKTLYLKLRSEEIHWIAQFMCLSVTVEHSFVLCLQIMLPCHGHLRVWVVLVANQEGGASSCTIQLLYIKSSSPIGRNPLQLIAPGVNCNSYGSHFFRWKGYPGEAGHALWI